MRHGSDASSEHQKTAFLDQLAGVQETFREKGIDYRIIGSLASHAFLGSDGAEGVPSLNFNREGAATPDQRVPDIDLIVPRDDLPVAREMRKKLIESSFPVKLGLANPTTEIDFLPKEDASLLTHKDMALPVSNELFRSETVPLHGVDIQTVPLDTLIHTFGTFGGKIRHKDVALLYALMRANDEPSDPETAVFHKYQKERRRRSPGQYLFLRTVEAFDAKAPRRLRNEMYRCALKAADILGKR